MSTSFKRKFKAQFILDLSAGTTEATILLEKESQIKSVRVQRHRTETKEDQFIDLYNRSHMGKRKPPKAKPKVTIILLYLLGLLNYYF